MMEKNRGRHPAMIPDLRMHWHKHANHHTDPQKCTDTYMPTYTPKTIIRKVIEYLPDVCRKTEFKPTLEREREIDQSTSLIT